MVELLLILIEYITLQNVYEPCTQIFPSWLTCAQMLQTRAVIDTLVSYKYANGSHVTIDSTRSGSTRFNDKRFLFIELSDPGWYHQRLKPLLLVLWYMTLCTQCVYTEINTLACSWLCYLWLIRRSGPGKADVLNTLRPRQNGRHFPDDILKCIFLNEKVWISIEISLKFVPKGPITNSLALV